MILIYTYVDCVNNVSGRIRDIVTWVTFILDGSAFVAFLYKTSLVNLPMTLDFFLDLASFYRFQNCAVCENR